MNGETDGNRAQIFEVVKETPGLNIQEIAEEVGLARTSVVYHIRQMIRANTVVTQRQGHHLLHFPSFMPVLEQRALAALRVPSIRAIIEKTFFEPKITKTELEDQLFLTTRTLRRALTRLQKDQLALVHKKARPGEAFIELHPNLRTLLGHHRELLDADRPPLAQPTGIKAWLLMLPHAWRVLASPW